MHYLTSISIGISNAKMNVSMPVVPGAAETVPASAVPVPAGRPALFGNIVLGNKALHLDERVAAAQVEPALVVDQIGRAHV